MARVQARRFPDEADMLLILFVLGVSYFVLRGNGWHAKRTPVVAPIGSSAAMDGLWRDAVRPLKEQDMRPQADPDMRWEEPEQEIHFPQPPAPAPAAARQEPQPEPEPFFPTPRPARKTAFKRPTLAPKSVSFANANGSPQTKAFLKTSRPGY